MSYKFAHLTLDEIETELRRIGNIWLKNNDLLLLEELIRRAKKCESGVNGMSWSIISDNNVLQIRASIANSEELAELIEALKKRQGDFFGLPAEQEEVKDD